LPYGNAFLILGMCTGIERTIALKEYSRLPCQNFSEGGLPAS